MGLLGLVLLGEGAHVRGGPPLQERRSGALLAQGSAFHAQLQQVVARDLDGARGTQPQNVHDLVTVEVGADRVELLLLAQGGDARLEVVVGGGQVVGLAAVAGRAVRARQAVEAPEEVARVGHVAAHRGVGPGGPAVAAGAPVQPAPVGDGLDRAPVAGQGLPAPARPLPAPPPGIAPAPETRTHAP